MKIYTKTGDKGETSLYGGTRTSKASARVECYGTIDELNACIGVAKSHIENEKLIAQLKKIQFDLFTLGSESATPADKLMLANGKPRLPLIITDEETLELEKWIDEMDAEIPPLQFFILPGGGKAATFLHVARTVCRRAERGMIELSETDDVRPELIRYLNRLSDYLFILARYVSYEAGEAEEYWNPAERKAKDS